jgi:hypothetical protein
MKKEFIEGVHYYLENGRVIMTAKYLLERGACCGNNCVNCPYHPRATKGSKDLRKVANNDTFSK